MTPPLPPNQGARFHSQYSNQLVRESQLTLTPALLYPQPYPNPNLYPNPNPYPNSNPNPNPSPSPHPTQVLESRGDGAWIMKKCSDCLQGTRHPNPNPTPTPHQARLTRTLTLTLTLPLLRCRQLHL